LIARSFLGHNFGSPAFNEAGFVVIPVPYEKTTTWGRGTAKGPQAVIEASFQVESFDEELLADFSSLTFTQKPLKTKTLQPVRSAVLRVLAAGKVPIMIGGEHTITAAAVSAAAEKYKDLSVLQIDAHADLRDSYGGDKYNHACVMRRVLEICPVVQAGLRNISREEHAFAKRSGQINKMFFLRPGEPLPVKKIISKLSGSVYVTIDIDGLDPSIMPSTGTPEPGGLLWHEILGLLNEVAEQKNVVAFDVVEFSPIKGLKAPDFTAAKLIYKMIGYIQTKS
jgi:agmatinase